MSNDYPAGAPRIAIIGAGMAGCSAAYFLREIFGDELAIVVFEKAQQVGGRVQRRAFAGTAIETGATLIHSSNAYLSTFIETLGLQRARPHNREDSKSSSLGIWNGTAFAFQSLPSSGATTVRMLARYRLAPLRTRALVRSMLERWTRIYELQQQQRAYATPRAMFEALDLFPWTQQASYTMFQQNRISRRFVDEFIDGVSRVNYGQDGTIHAFVNLTSLVGAGLGGGELFSVQGGNAQVCERLLSQARVEMRTQTAVESIGAIDDPAQNRRRYAIETEQQREQGFDGVILATPLELATIQLDPLAEWSPEYAKRPYQVTHATFVAGQLSPGYFGQKSRSPLPDTILTTERHGLPFSSIGRVGYSPTLDLPIYKVFSREPLDDELIGRVFARPAETTRVCWHAYPVLKPTAQWPPFRIAHGLYYANAMESAVSTMETEVVASRNVVQLLAQDICSASGVGTMAARQVRI